jgi:hypothetical protein
MLHEYADITVTAFACRFEAYHGTTFESLVCTLWDYIKFEERLLRWAIPDVMLL